MKPRSLQPKATETVIKRMIQLLAGRAEVRDLRELERAVLERQKLQPPLLGDGVALPHATVRH